MIRWEALAARRAQGTADQPSYSQQRARVGTLRMASFISSVSASCPSAERSTWAGEKGGREGRAGRGTGRRFGRPVSTSGHEHEQGGPPQQPLHNCSGSSRPAP